MSEPWRGFGSETRDTVQAVTVALGSHPDDRGPLTHEVVALQLRRAYAAGLLEASRRTHDENETARLRSRARAVERGEVAGE